MINGPAVHTVYTISTSSHTAHTLPQYSCKEAKGTQELLTACRGFGPGSPEQVSLVLLHRLLGPPGEGELRGPRFISSAVARGDWNALEFSARQAYRAVLSKATTIASAPSVAKHLSARIQGKQPFTSLVHLRDMIVGLYSKEILWSLDHSTSEKSGRVAEGLNMI